MQESLTYKLCVPHFLARPQNRMDIDLVGNLGKIAGGAKIRGSFGQPELVLQTM